VITKGTCFHPYQLSMLASLGITEVLIYPTPSIALIITGNELVKPGDSLAFGQVYESNSIGLVSALKAIGVSNITTLYSKDILSDTVAAIHQALNLADMIILTGGVSVGDYDYVAEACKKVGVIQLFHGIKQKPGKPMYVGKYHQKLVFGLPGNPSSVLHCFQQYVKPSIERSCAKQSAVPVKAILSTEFQKKAGLDFFLKAALKDGVVEILPAQASYQVAAFSNANCWVELPAEESLFLKGDTVTVYLFK
jgi:molybdopterin molybdotransferase